ncbi:hypothetical protein EDD16DRAFT_1897450 [Pisolithus croceorrhizus]|nr:hypothetical protein EDD16DRAFT_1897450 [Pisolithus croceorrhizus]KAI6125497.1 hypothetical protein EV401DRAFT_1937998 [Pisolithus croceorrhizus]
MSVFLCVDCGGSKTSAVICDANGNILGRGLGGPSNFSYIPLAAFTEAVRVAVSSALSSCVNTPITLPPPTELFVSAWFGIAGVDSPSVAQNASIALSVLLGIPAGPRLIVANDTHLLAAPLRLHLDIPHAITAIAGTGSCVVSFTKEPSGKLVELARAGGWGWLLGDEGSGYHVGREAIRQIMLDVSRASLGMSLLYKSTLKCKILSHFGIKSEQAAAEILAIVHTPEKAINNSDNIPGYLLVPREKRLSQLTPLVFEAAFKDNDEFALRVLRNVAGGLADQIAQLCIGPGENLAIKPRGVVATEAILCFGGSLVGVEGYRALVLDELRKRGCVFRHVELVQDAAAVGAAGLATMTAA